MVAGLSPSTRYREAEDYMTSDWKWCMGRILMAYEELIGILCVCKLEGELQLGLKKKQEVVRVPTLAFNHIRLAQ